MTTTMLDGIEYRRFDHIYLVSRCGRFLRYGLEKEPSLRPDGYLQIGRQQLAHRLVATCWCERPEGATHVHHINGVKTDNRAENLEWVSPKEHFADRHRGTMGRNPMSDEGKARLRALRLGSVVSEETKQKQREATLRLGLRPPPRPKGTRMGAAAIQRMRENSPNARGCVIDGVSYASFNEAERMLGVKAHTLRKRCLSKSFPSYRLAERSI